MTRIPFARILFLAALLLISPFSQAAPASTRTGLGIASAGAVTGSSLVSAALGTALSSLHQLDDKNTVQTFFGISSTSPFVFGMGGLYKYTLMGDRENGFHLGGGLGLGTGAASGAALAAGSSTTFFIRFLGDTGVHFSIPKLERIVFNLDAGLIMDINNGVFSMAIGGYSSLLGLSVHYML